MRRPRRSLTLVTAPAGEPVSLPEARAWCRLDDDTPTNLTLTALVASARTAAEQYLRRSLISQTWMLTLDLAPSGFGSSYSDGLYDLPVSSLYGGLPRAVELPKGPIRSIASVTTYDTSDADTTLAPGSYRVDAAGERLVLANGANWPSGLRAIGACEIEYVAGYGDAAAVPQPIKNGILIHVASLYEQRGNCEDAMALPPGTAQLYGPYRILGDRLG